MSEQPTSLSTTVLLQHCGKLLTANFSTLALNILKKNYVFQDKFSKLWKKLFFLQSVTFLICNNHVTSLYCKYYCFISKFSFYSNSPSLFFPTRCLLSLPCFWKEAHHEWVRVTLILHCPKNNLNVFIKKPSLQSRLEQKQRIISMVSVPGRYIANKSRTYTVAVANAPNVTCLVFKQRFRS